MYLIVTKKKLIHGFPISIMVLILPFFQQLLLRNEEKLSNIFQCGQTKQCDLQVAFECSSEDSFFLSELRIKLSNRHMITGNLNINSVFNKFDQLKAMIVKVKLIFL